MTKAQEQLGWSLMQAACVVPVVCFIGYGVVKVQEGTAIWSMLFGSIFAMLISFVIGWPFALAIGAIPAIVFGKKLRERSRGAIVGTVVYSTITGAVSVASLWHYFGEDGFGTMTITGAIAGFLAGWCFCVLAGRK